MYARTENNRIASEIVKAVLVAKARNFAIARAEKERIKRYLTAHFSKYLA